MTDKKTEALKLALEALDELNYCSSSHAADDIYYKTLAAINEALVEQPAIPQGDIAMPRSIEEAEAMEKLGYAYLQQHAPEMLKEQPAQQEPVACKTLCELCVKRGYHFCANAAQTTPIPSPPASKPWVALTDEDVMAIAFNFDVSSL